MKTHKVNVWTDGGFIGTGNAGTTNEDRIHLFSDDTATAFATADVGDYIIYTGVVSTTNIRRVEEYLALKYNIELEPV